MLRTTLPWQGWDPSSLMSAKVDGVHSHLDGLHILFHHLHHSAIQTITALLLNVLNSPTSPGIGLCIVPERPRRRQVLGPLGSSWRLQRVEMKH